MEEYAYVLDYLEEGVNFAKKESICYAVGDDEFKLFELVPKSGVIINIDDRVYIGKDPALRKEIDHVKRRIGYEDLTGTAVKELEFVVREIVEKNEQKYVEFYYTAGALSIKKHTLEELPGLGKKSLNIILEERKKGPFKDFEDLATRTAIKTPEKLIVARILLEIEDPERKRYLFVSR